MSRIGRDYAYRKTRARMVRDAQLCAICGGFLDHDAPPRSSLAPSADHIYPVSMMVGFEPRAARSLAADPSNLRIVHVGCNSRRGAGRRSGPVHVSRSWF